MEFLKELTAEHFTEIEIVPGDELEMVDEIFVPDPIFVLRGIVPLNHFLHYGFKMAMPENPDVVYEWHLTYNNISTGEICAVAWPSRNEKSAVSLRS